MYHNLSRRFTFALTIGNRKARLWFFSRFLVMSTVEFDWLEVRIIVALPYALLVSFPAVGSCTSRSFPDLVGFRYHGRTWI